MSIFQCADYTDLVDSFRYKKQSVKKVDFVPTTEIDSFLIDLESDMTIKLNKTIDL